LTTPFALNTSLGVFLQIFTIFFGRELIRFLGIANLLNCNSQFSRWLRAANTSRKRKLNAKSLKIPLWLLQLCVFYSPSTKTKYKNTKKEEKNNAWHKYI